MELVKVVSEKLDATGRPYLDYYLVDAEHKVYFRVRPAFHTDYHYFVKCCSRGFTGGEFKEYVATLK